MFVTIYQACKFDIYYHSNNYDEFGGHLCDHCRGYGLQPYCCGQGSRVCVVLERRDSKEKEEQDTPREEGHDEIKA